MAESKARLWRQKGVGQTKWEKPRMSAFNEKNFFWDKMFPAFFALVFITILIMVGVQVWAVIKGVNYVTSGEAGELVKDVAKELGK